MMVEIKNELMVAKSEVPVRGKALRKGAISSKIS